MDEDCGCETSRELDELYRSYYEIEAENRRLRAFIVAELQKAG